jgi:hypothetical protein
MSTRDSRRLSPQEREVGLSPTVLTQILDMREALQRAHDRESLLKLQLEMARNVNTDLMTDYVDATQREVALKRDLTEVDERAFVAQIALRVVQGKLVRALDEKAVLEDVLATGKRVLGRLEQQHALELGLVAEGVAVGAVLNARQPWIEEEKDHFINEVNALLDSPPKILKVYDVSSRASTTESQTQILTPPQEAEELQPQARELEDPFTPPRHIRHRQGAHHHGPPRPMLNPKVVYDHSDMPVSPSPRR